MHETRTRSPTFTFFTPVPTASTVPTASWPRMRPSVTSGTSPLRIWRSEPQIVVASTRTMASVSSTRTGLGTSSHALLLAPWYTRACIIDLDAVAPAYVAGAGMGRASVLITFLRCAGVVEPERPTTSLVVKPQTRRLSVLCDLRLGTRSVPASNPLLGFAKSL